MAISQNYPGMTDDDGVPVESLAPETGTQGGNTAIFWQARVLPYGNYQTDGAGVNQTGEGTEIQKIRYYGEKFQYQAKNRTGWTDFNTGARQKDQLVFYYLIKTNFVAGIQINVSDWPASGVDGYTSSFRKVTYRVYEVDDSGNEISNWENKSNWQKSTYYYSDVQISAIQVRMNELEQYSIQKIQITGENDAFNNGHSIDKEPTISGNGYSSDFGLDLRGVNPTKEVFVNIYVKAYKYTVTYMDGEQPCGNPTSYLPNNTVTVKEPLTKQGYNFKGWQADSANANLVIENGEFTMPARDVVFTAVWDEAEKVNVTYTVTSTENPEPVIGMPDNSQVYKGSNVSAGSDPTTTSTTNGNKQGTWRFSGWETNDNQTNVQNDVHYTGSWTFTEAKKYTITIHYIDDAQTPKKIKAAEVITQYDGSKYDVMDKIPNRINKDYVKESVDGSITGTVTGKNVEITVVYTKDVLVDSTVVPKPNGPGDNIPDKYQVTINYVSSDTTIGRITGRTQEVLTIYVDKKPASNGTVQANGSTAEATGSRNYFSNWTKEKKDGTQVGANTTLEPLEIKDAEGGKTYTFYANFYHRSGGGSSRPSTPPTVDIPDDVPTGLNGKDHYAYIIGYGNNDVRPQNNITRAEVATIFFRLLTDETREANMTKSNGYNDVKDGDWFCCAVSTLSKMGIIKGYEDGSFKPNDPISRAEFAAIAARFDPDGDKTPATFADVTSHWAKDEISIAANHGWIKGYEDGSFKPDQKITRAETMTLVNRVLNRLPETKDDLHKDMKTWVDNMDETAWYYLAVQEATNSHYFKNKTSTKFEQWTDLRDTRDWSELEK